MKKKGTNGTNLLKGASGADELRGLGGNDKLYGLGSKDKLFGDAGNDRLYGGNDADTLYGGAGKDILDGGTGADHMLGGTGNDTYYVDDAADRADESGGDGADIVVASVSYTLGKGLENLILTGTGNLNGTGNTGNNHLTGNSGSNILTGGDGNDILDGGAGDDTLYGGKGNDTYVVDSVKDKVDEMGPFGGGIDTVMTALDKYLLGDDIENLVLTGSSALTGYGNELDNRIYANKGGDAIYGGAGKDMLFGGTGGDQLYGDDGDDTLYGGDGVDSLQGGIGKDVLYGGANVDILYGGVDDDTLYGGAGEDDLTGGDGNDRLYGGDANDSLFGQKGNDTIYGGNGNDFIDGAEGDDIMFGGKGDDDYRVNSAKDVVDETGGGGIDSVTSTVSFVLPTGVENLYLGDFDDIDGTGNAGDNIIHGNYGTNTLKGLGGNDTLRGDAKDHLIGGSGNDTYEVGSQLTNVDETDGQGHDSGGIDTVVASCSYVLGAYLENLTLNPWSGNIDGTGNALDNRIIGNDHANTLSGGDGNDWLDGGGAQPGQHDTLKGGKGNDTYVVHSSDDVADDTDGAGHDLGGIDTVRASVDYTLGYFVENLVMTGDGDLSGGGNNLDNIITGHAHIDRLHGFVGNDTLYGGADDDWLWGDEDNDKLYGGDGTDQLYGGDDSDRLDGGSGNDILTGGVGADSFVFSTRLSAKTNLDHIADFSALEDRILLDHHIFKSLKKGVLAKSAFTSNTTGHATHASDRIIYDTKTGKLYYDDDGTGHHAAVLIAVLDNQEHLTSSLFTVY
nr:calcium-binding protein [uncultured Gellertiella sp.]